MNLKLLLVLLLMLAVAIFSVQNAGIITVRFLHWHFAWSQALVILVSALAGALGGLLVGALAGRPRKTKPGPSSAKSDRR